MIIYLSLAICLIGLFVWFANVPTPKPWAKLGEWMFAVGLLAFLLAAVPTLLHLFSH